MTSDPRASAKDRPWRGAGTMRLLVMALLLLYSSEAWMSVVASPRSLREVVEAASIVVVAERSQPYVGSGPEAFRVLETLFTTEADAPPQEILVESPNRRLYEQISEAQQKGQPYPFPIVPSYQAARPLDPVSVETMILFLRKVDDPSGRRFAMVVEDAREWVSSKPQVVALLRKLKSKRGATKGAPPKHGRSPR